jgi:hypothetical protein
MSDAKREFFGPITVEIMVSHSKETNLSEVTKYIEELLISLSTMRRWDAETDTLISVTSVKYLLPGEEQEKVAKKSKLPWPQRKK